MVRRRKEKEAVTRAKGVKEAKEKVRNARIR